MVNTIKLTNKDLAKRKKMERLFINIGMIGIFVLVINYSFFIYVLEQCRSQTLEIELPTGDLNLTIDNNGQNESLSFDKYVHLTSNEQPID